MMMKISPNILLIFMKSQMVIVESASEFHPYSQSDYYPSECLSDVTKVIHFIAAKTLKFVRTKISPLFCLTLIFIQSTPISLKSQ